MFNIIRSMLGFQATPAADQTSSSDRFPDLPRLPNIPEKRMADPLQDTLGTALSLVARSSRLNPEVIEKRLSLLWGKSIADIKTEIILIFQGLVPVSPQLVEDFAMILRQPKDAVYRVALFLKQQKGCSEQEMLEDLTREIPRRLKERGDDTNSAL